MEGNGKGETKTSLHEKLSDLAEFIKNVSKIVDEVVEFVKKETKK